MEDIILDEAFTVSQVNSYIKGRFAADENLRALTVKGEVSNFVNHKKTGHFYFTLKDNAASIKAVMFKGNAEKVRFEIENGMNVIIRGSIAVFERDGVYQLYCETLEPDGMGALFLAFEQLKARLAALNMFDEAHKKPIPKMPKKIGVVTAKTGAALQDILNILSRRYPLCTVLVIPALVQGEKAPDSIVLGIKAAQSFKDIDVLIVGRGGGSIEDLWAFNDERVARAIYDCEIPIISAVGHEIDFTIADFVADLRAPTPSAAAELAVPDILGVAEGINTAAYRLHNLADMRIKQLYERLKADYRHLTAYSPKNRVNEALDELSSKSARLNAAIEKKLLQKSELFGTALATLEALSPLKVLTRGYSITFLKDKPINTVKSAAVGEELITRLSDGMLYSTVTGLQKQAKSRRK